MQRDEAPDPSRVLSTEEFARQLRLLKVWAGDPSYDELRRRTGLARSTLFDGLSLRRSRLPSLDLVRHVVAACGCGPEEVARWEAAWRRLRQELTPTPAADASPRPVPAPRQLPGDVPGFVGREEQLARLDALTAPPAGRAPLVVISGPAGVGKTALAVRWAHWAAARYPDGQLHVDLRGHSLGPEMPPAQALALLLAALGAPEEQLPVGQDALIGRYRTVTADRRLLLVLDNAASVAQVRPLLPSGPGCAVLVTSRTSLAGLMARDGASPLRLDVLHDSESRRLLRDALGESRVSGEPDAVAELTRLCGHLPLALRIAAAQLAERADGSIAAYAAELGSGDRLAGLAVDGDEESAVRGAFDLSYAALSPEARLLFRRLGAAPTPSIGPAAGAVLAGLEADRAAALLGVLADGHLVEPLGAGEHRLHDLVRLYAAERAEREDGEAARQAAVSRLLQWYAASARAAGELVAPTVSYLPSIGGPALRFRGRDEAYDWLERQRHNLAAAVEHAAGLRLWPTVIALVDGVRGFLQLRGYRADWLTLVHIGLDAARCAGDERAQAAMHMAAGLAHWSTGDAQEGIEHYDLCLGLQRRLSNRVGEAGTLSNLGMAYHSLGQPDRAVSYHMEGLAVSREIGDLDREADALNNLGFLYCELGRLDEATESLHEARRRYQKLGRPERETAAEINLGLTRYEQGRLAEASAHYRRSLELAHRTGRGVLAEITYNLATVHQDLGHYPQAAKYARRALTLAEETQDRVVEAGALNAYGTVLTLRGEPGRAAPYHERALGVARQMGNPRSEAEAALGLASAWLADSGSGSGSAAEAAAQTQRAVQIARSGLGLLLGRALTTASAVCLASGEPQRARELAAEAVAECRRRGQRLGQARALLALGRAQRDSGSPEAARESWSAASALVESMGVPESHVVRDLLAQ